MLERAQARRKRITLSRILDRAFMLTSRHYLGEAGSDISIRADSIPLNAAT